MAFWCIVTILALRCRGRNIPREQGRCFALTPYVFRSSVAIVLTTKGKWFLTFHEFQLCFLEFQLSLEFQLPLPYQGHGKCKYDFILPQIDSACKKDYWPKHITIMTQVRYWISATLKIAILLVVNSNVNTLHPRNYVDGWIIHFDVIKWKHFRRYRFFCAGNSPVTGEFPVQRPVTRSFGVVFDLRLKRQLSKQWGRWRFGMPLRSLWRNCNVFRSVRYWTGVPICFKVSSSLALAKY